MDIDLLSLRKQILEKANISIITPADCKRIAFLISRTVHKNVSETTMKRLFGFAKTSHNFSKYTLVALMEFIGKDSEQEIFADKGNNYNNNSSQLIADLFAESRKLSHNTLNNIKNRCTISYEFTVSR